MNSRLTVYTLGQVTILLDGRPVTELSSRTAEALLIYLIYQKRPVSRQVLADFFWDDRAPERGAANLRTLLTMLRKPLGEFLLITRQTVAFDHDADCWLDAAVLEQKLADLAPSLESALPLSDETLARLRAALDLYQGDFLEGFYLSESHAFEEWTLQIQERLRRLVAVGLRRLVAVCLGAGDYQAGIHFAGRLLAIDNYDEETQRQLMWLYLRSGQRNAALEQYRRCRDLLVRELGLEPDPATTALYERFRAITFPPLLRLPLDPTPFVGREAELAEIGQRLSDPTCRLLTILGPGGMGKTRLAIRAAAQVYQARPGAFLDGIHFVALASIQNAGQLAAAIATTLHLPFEGGRDPQGQLLNYLQHKELLLVLDSVEQLAGNDEAVAFIGRLLDRAGGVTLLVTSRTRLDLHEEWLFDVEGLAYPLPDTAGDGAIESYAAVQLFVQNATRLQRTFAPTTADWAAIVRVCQLLSGAPLGLELASAWVRRHTCTEIAAQIAADLDFLTTSLRNVPLRHRSLRAVFEHSWQLLSDEEQVALCQLAVFQGQIAPTAAQAVASASPALLRALASQSLLRKADQDGAFAMHELIRQYALEKLATLPELAEYTWRAFCSYFARFLDQRADSLKGRGQQEALQEISYEVENVRAAWDAAVCRRLRDELAQMLEAFYWYQWQRGYFQEGRAALSTAAAALTAEGMADDLLLARIQSRLGEYHSWLSNYETATCLVEASVPVLRRATAWVDLAWALDTLGQIAYAQGEFSTARGYFEEALTWFQRQEVAAGVAHSLTTLANVYCDELADYAAAQTFYQESLALYREIGDRYGEAKSVINQGTLAHSLGQHEVAAGYYREGIALCRELGHRQALAIALNNLGQVLDKLGSPAEAATLLHESVSLRRELADQRGLALTLMSLGNVAARLEQPRQAQQHYAEALRTAQQLGSPGLLAELLVGLADLLVDWGEASGAAALLAQILNEQIEGVEIQQKAQTIWGRIAAQNRVALATGQADAAGKTITMLVDEALGWLTRQPYKT
jgi:predicted ATPase/DNA-binding SARP family transcriptional activator